MNLGQLRLALDRRLRADYEGEALVELINTALHAAEVERDWYWYQATATVTTAASTATYPLPANWKRTARLYMADTPVLEYADPDTFRSRFFGSPAPSAKPDTWSYWSGQLLLGPTPDAIYSVTHEYLKTEPDLALDTDTPLMPARYHGAIIEQALLLAVDVLGAEVPDRRLVRAQKSWDTWMTKMRRENKVHRGGVAVRVTGP